MQNDKIKSSLLPDTIVAIATPPGRGGVGIVRLSGPKALAIAKTVTEKNPQSHQATFCHFLDKCGEIIDFGYLLYFKAPHSFTGEDVVEFQGHGGPVVMDLLIKRLLECGARFAEAGEFSRRAFMNDKMDLVQAEAVADLIEAANETSVRLAQRSLQGQFSQEIQRLLTNLVALRVHVEAALDFPEEEIDFLKDKKISTNLNQLINELSQVLTNARQGALLSEGIEVVIVGEPNAGKSTLINRLSGQESAIVTDIPGTTRDVIREKINIDGLPLHLVDTAGLRESSDLVELEGIKRAEKAASLADLVLLLIDGNANADIKSAQAKLRARVGDKRLITIVNKLDLLEKGKDDSLLYISAKTGEGMGALKEAIKTQAGLAPDAEEGAFIARRRHLDALSKALSALEEGERQLIQHKAGELLAEDLRQAQGFLSSVTGEFSADDLLGEIFSSFCIGK